jgi:hypothetical protein
VHLPYVSECEGYAVSLEGLKSVLLQSSVRMVGVCARVCVCVPRTLSLTHTRIQRCFILLCFDVPLSHFIIVFFLSADNVDEALFSGPAACGTLLRCVERNLLLAASTACADGVAPRSSQVKVTVSFLQLSLPPVSIQDKSGKVACVFVVCFFP